MESRALGLGLVEVEKHDVCRLCMIEHEYCLSVFLANEVCMTSLGEFIRDLLNLEVSEGDGLPGTACSLCVEKLMEFRKFKEMCIHSAKELRRHVPTGGGDLKLRSFRTAKGVDSISCDGKIVKMTETAKCPVDGEGVAVGLMDGGGGIDCMNVEDESTVPNEACDPLAYDNLCLVKNEGVPMQFLGEVASRYQSYSVNCESGVPRVGNELSLDPLSFKNETDREEVYPRDPLGDYDDCPEEDTAEGECNEDAVVCSELIPFVVGDQGEVKEESEFPELVGKGGSHSNDGYEGYSSVTAGPSLSSDPLANMDVVDRCSIIGGLTEVPENEFDEFGAVRQGISQKTVLNNPSCDPLREENLQLDHSFANPFVANSFPVRRVNEQKKNVKFYALSKKDSQLNNRARPVRIHKHDQICHQPENTSIPTEYICNYCSTKYSEKRSLALHIKTHLNGKKSASVLPGKEFSPKFSQNLLVKDRGNIEPVTLETSNVSFTQKSATRKNEKPTVECSRGENLGSELGHSRTLLFHSVKLLEKASFVCDTCGIAFLKKGDLMKHVNVHTGLNPLHCRFCGDKLISKGMVNRHQAVHSGVERLKCNQCGKECITYRYQQKRVVTYTNFKSLQCDLCGKNLKNNRNLKTHLLIHTGVKPFKCNECGKMFTTSSDLNRHSVVHTGVKAFKCNDCGKMFTSSGDLNRHLVVHTGVKRFKCNECGQMFSQSGNLRAHSRIHSGVKPFKCNDCGKMFTTSSKLKCHSVVHTGVRPFKCDFCGKQFKWKATFNRHLLTHADRNPSK